MKVYDYKKRGEALIGISEKAGLDSFFVTDETNVTYLSGFLGGDSMLLLSGKKRFFITDSRYVEEARRTVAGFEIIQVKETTYETITDLAAKNRLRRMGFESMNLPFEIANRLASRIGNTKLIPSKNAIETIRAVKDESEIRAIKKSVRLAKKVLEKAVRSARPGRTEVSIANHIEGWFVEHGARISFEPIVAAGNNAAMPHARPGRAKIRKNDFVMIDLGAKLDSYNSDITRMAMLGRQSPRFREMYDIVDEARKRAIAKIRPGVGISDVDKAARSFMEGEGYGRSFGHATGHGVGMSIHEEPSISGSNPGKLVSGMVFTVEPAIYIPGFGGVRIEDMVLVTDNGCEVLTR